MTATKAIQRPYALCAILLAALLSTACVQTTGGIGTRAAQTVDDLSPEETPAHPVSVTILDDLTTGGAVTVGYILDLYEQGGQWHISVDEIEWLTGKDAVEAMVEAGSCASWETDCEPPNGFYIRNREESTRSYPLSKQATISMQTLSHGPDGNFNWDEQIDLDRFRQILEGDPGSPLRTVPYQITVVGGTVTAIREVYIP